MASTTIQQRLWIGCDLINNVNANYTFKVCYHALYKQVFQAEADLKAQ